MGHDHHHPVAAASKVNAAFRFGILLNFAFVLIEAGFGFYIHSLSLLSDAAHNLADVGTLALCLLAFRLLKVKATDQYTYGYRKTSILVALFNSVVLLVAIGGIALEAIHKALSPPDPLPGDVIAWVAGIGIVINSVTALLFFREKEKDINIKSAYLHLMSDALVSAGIVVGGLVIYFTRWYWVDPMLSLIIAGVILFSTWQLLKASLRLSLDGVPHDIRLAEIKAMVLNVEGVKGIHHIHIWAISSTENAMTAHLVTTAGTTSEQEHHIKDHLRHELLHRNIQHVTIETEKEDEVCTSGVC